MKVDIFSDIACPWCYVGQVRFERALEEFPGRASVEVAYRPYQLNPALPYEPQPLLDYYLARGGADFRDEHARIAGVARLDGLDLRLEQALAVNTLPAHRLVWLAARDYDAGIQHAVKHALMRTYLTDGGNVADLDTLVTLAGSADMDTRRVRADLASGAGTAEVKAAMRNAREIGIQAVPTFVFNGRVAIRGAAETATFRRLLEELAAQDAAAAPDAGACGADTCSV
ncbi:DsbA family protein [Streptomyces sp. NPDC053474]|uniref:DsbA family protein n=1 Tax=Streptomyces sp. NPDC053474 TaxID=3365704 RepID=UPI0037D4E9B4